MIALFKRTGSKRPTRCKNKTGYRTFKNGVLFKKVKLLKFFKCVTITEDRTGKMECERTSPVSLCALVGRTLWMDHPQRALVF